MSRRIRLLAALVSVLALTATGFVATSAQAASVATLSGRVVDAANEPVRGLTVFGIHVTRDDDQGTFFFATTNSAGRFATSKHDRLRPGSWEFTVFDQAGDYAQRSIERKLASGTNVIPDVAVQLGGHASGTVTAPSGKRLKNVDIYAENTESDEDDLVGSAYDTTGSNGAFQLDGLQVGTYGVYSGFEPEDTDATVSFEITAPGQTVTGVKLANVRVFPKLKLTGTSPGKRKARLKLSVSAARYGIANAGGRFDLYLGTKKIRSAVGFSKGKRTVNLAGIGKGKRTFRFKYLGSTDTRSQWSKKVKVTIR